jgi:serine/threonine protein kinase
MSKLDDRLHTVAARLQVEENDIKKILNESSFDTSNITAKETLPSGDFKAERNGVFYNIKFYRGHAEDFLMEAVVLALGSRCATQTYLPRFYMHGLVPYHLQSALNVSSLMIVSEYCHYGTLDNYIANTFIPQAHLTSSSDTPSINATLITIIKGVFQALHFLHSQLHISHGSLNGNSVLINENLQPKLINFSDAIRFQGKHASNNNCDVVYIQPYCMLLL